jgi:hypothetical protein
VGLALVAGEAGVLNSGGSGITVVGQYGTTVAMIVTHASFKYTVIPIINPATRTGNYIITYEPSVQMAFARAT